MNPLAVNSLATQLKFSAISLNSIKSSHHACGVVLNTLMVIPYPRVYDVLIIANRQSK